MVMIDHCRFSKVLARYVDMSKPFLASYLQLVVETCRRRGAPATGGMAAQVSFWWQDF